MLRGRAIPITTFFALFYLGFFVDFGETGQLGKLLTDCAHVPAFGAVFLFLWWLLKPRPYTALISFSVSAFLAIAVELIQPIFGRSCSLEDIIYGIIGMLAAGTLPFYLRWGAKLASIYAALCSLLCIVFPLRPVYHELELSKLRNARLPLIADFSDIRELEFWEPIAERAPEERLTVEKIDGLDVLKISTVPLRYSGAELRLESMNFEPYKSVILKVYLKEATKLNLRIDDWGDCDSFEERFNRSFYLNGGWNEIQIPVSDITSSVKSREFGINALKRLLLFIDPNQKPIAVYVTRVALQ